VAADDILSFAVTSRLAVGSSLLVELESDTYQTDLHGEVPTVDAVATHDPETGQSAIFVVNRSRHAAAAFTVDAGRLGDVSILETHTLNDDDIYVANTLEDLYRVTLAPNETARVDGGQMTVELPRLLDGHRLGLTALAGERPSESTDGSLSRTPNTDRR
jgi:alpha-N-arabinofuranosidase